ncbi:hypothetical protein ATER59S_04645 [Aquamicrobium terrae]
MMRKFDRTAPAFACAALAVLLASAAARSAATHGNDPAAATAAQQLFPDAPDGVDPVVTGPVSAAFRQRQADAGCDKAVWPQIPAQCYPR